MVVDGGNSRYTDSLDGAEILASRGIGSCDVGGSGGRWGLEEGYRLMVGAEEEMFARLEPIFAAWHPIVATPEWGTSGLGISRRWSMKMVHNGIEYGLLQAYGRGSNCWRPARSSPSTWARWPSDGGTRDGVSGGPHFFRWATACWPSSDGSGPPYPPRPVVAR